MRRVGSIVVLIALVAFYVSSRLADDSSLTAAPAIDRPAWTGARVGFDEHGTPTVRMTESDPNLAEVACRREADRKVPVKSVLGAAIAIPKLEQRARQTSRDYDAFVRSHSEKTFAPAALNRYRQVKAAMRSARADYTVAGESYYRLAHDHNDALEACASGDSS